MIYGISHFDIFSSNSLESLSNEWPKEWIKFECSRLLVFFLFKSISTMSLGIVKTLQVAWQVSSFLGFWQDSVNSSF